ncbi:MAG TPA: DUF4062 domain-containing protein [Chitinophagaceae bacterium]
MNPQPTVFISSVISEFQDLRSALKYFLENSGCRVLMSEASGFGAEPDKDSLVACKQQIAKADYYLLLIGDNPGTIFEIDGRKTTVTIEEFRYYCFIKSTNAMRLMPFIREKTWGKYNNNDPLLCPLQINLIQEVTGSLPDEERKLGRWINRFDEFQDIVNSFEATKSGLFIEANRKSSIYRTYIKRELTDIFKIFITRNTESGKLQSITEFLALPDIQFTDPITPMQIQKDIAIKIQIFLMFLDKKESLLKKINRTFNYIAHGEFARFDTANEIYILPEFIKLTEQTLEILEKVFDHANNIYLFEQIKKRDKDNFNVSKVEYLFVQSLCLDLKIVISKLVNLMNCLWNNWFDLEKQPDSFYAYRYTVSDKISDEDIIEYSKEYFTLNKDN